MTRMTIKMIMRIMAMTTMNVFHQGQIDHKLRPIRAAHQSEHSRPHVMSCYVIVVTNTMMNVVPCYVIVVTNIMMNVMSCHHCDQHHDECHDVMRALMSVINVEIIMKFSFEMFLSFHWEAVIDLCCSAAFELFS